MPLQLHLIYFNVISSNFRADNMSFLLVSSEVRSILNIQDPQLKYNWISLPFDTFSSFSRTLRQKEISFNQGSLWGSWSIPGLLLCLECKCHKDREMLVDSWRDIVIYSSKEAWRTHTCLKQLINHCLSKHNNISLEKVPVGKCVSNTWDCSWMIQF